ncbi:MAG: type IV pilus assembly protein PilM [Gemmatimonadetes bacterium]|nr:type IV pilus assembly protein PilM [Gemmatimonadota bacterium]MCB9504801.1 type IV pilus assembly protein PilM [Gemmatimonadales bacterium]MCA9762508.1 type IV pilus assembly protein PilM [Gemmatimonadota bacterium]MCA9769263.1 type IV pilus assembly protein PilM [Gemmatimonadota bacterium]MCB9518805.1 type IV pilus assembly protein PilM [Gemmatimonadales bacterium]
MALFPRARSTVGLDIGSGFIKAVVIGHGSGSPVIEKIAIAPVADDAIVEGEVMDPRLVANAVRDLLGASQIKARDVVVAVGGRDVIIKKIQMDRMKEAEAREVIRWEADQHVPFDPENVELDFQILDPEGDGLQMQVLLVAAKRELVESKLALLAEIGLDARVIDVEAFALHNAFERNYPEAMKGIVALANIGHETTIVNLLEDGVPVLTRDLPVGVRRLREDLQRERGMAADAADRIVRGGDLDPSLAPHVATRGEEMALGIERAAAFLQTSSRSGGLTRVYLTGGGSRVPGLASVLADRLKVQVTQAHPVERIDAAPEAFAGYAIDDVAPLLMLPVGLALRAAA